MWYIAKNFYYPEEPNFELVYFETKAEVDNYLTEYITDMSTTPMSDIENGEFYEEMKRRYDDLQEKHPGDVVNQALELVCENDEDWKIDVIINIDKSGYFQYTEQGCRLEKMINPKWLVYKIDKNEKDQYEFELAVFSTDKEFKDEYYDDYEYEKDPETMEDWVEDILCNMDEDNTGIVAIQNLQQDIVPVWTLEYDENE